MYYVDESMENHANNEGGGLLDLIFNYSVHPTDISKI
jgi:hypothetical protein